MGCNTGRRRRQLLRTVQLGIIIEAGMLLFFTGMFYKERRESAVATTAGVTAVIHGDAEKSGTAQEQTEVDEEGAQQQTEIDEEGVQEQTETGDSEEKKFIKWVDFNVTSEAMHLALEYDLETHGTETPIDWVTLLAYAGTRGGGSFNQQSQKYIYAAAQSIMKGEETIESLTADMEYYPYYLEAYEAVLGGYVGEYRMEDAADADDGLQYGVKVFSPIAKGFGYSDYDDFGSSRSYGYSRPHLGHDMIGMIGTPIIAIESGYVEAIGWNQYGGWRLGIRSFDGRRYYYYAHLRQNYPYAEGLEEGSVVTAGDVIGYMGHTGYSTTENTNNIKVVHLHWGLELIFDESQKDSNNEIWIDCYELTRFLSGYRSEAAKVGETREWVRVRDMFDPAVEAFIAK